MSDLLQLESPNRSRENSTRREKCLGHLEVRYVASSLGAVAAWPLCLSLTHLDTVLAFLRSLIPPARTYGDGY
jgi:hypothetical protein